MKSINYYMALAGAINHIVDNDVSLLDLETADNLCGHYWPLIAEVFSDLKAGVLDTDGCFHVTLPHRLLPALADAQDRIEVLLQRRADRELVNKERIENITYSRNAYKLAERSFKWNKRHIVITSIVALAQIAQWILLIWR